VRWGRIIHKGIIIMILGHSRDGMDRRRIGGDLQRIMIVSSIVSHINKLGLFPYLCLVSSLHMNDFNLVMIAFI
jgi:hypothetical protein